MVSMAKTSLPVEVYFSSKRPLAFTAMVEFYDDGGNKFTVPVSGVTDNSLLTVYPYVEGNKADLTVSAPSGSGGCLSFRLMTFLCTVVLVRSGQGD